MLQIYMSRTKGSKWLNIVRNFKIVLSLMTKHKQMTGSVTCILIAKLYDYRDPTGKQLTEEWRDALLFLVEEKHKYSIYCTDVWYHSQG